MELPHEEAWARGRALDGEEQRAFWAGWVAAERRHFAEDPSRPFAGLLVLQRPEGYEVLSGPDGSFGPNQPFTDSDDSSAVC
jgi:hypothetical protein